MKKAAHYFLFFTFFISTIGHAAESASRQFHGSGEVISVDAVYSQVTIHHKAIKDFSGDRDSEFYVSSPDILKNIQKGDLVVFDLTDKKGDVKIEKIEKTGVAPPKDEGTPLGQAVHDVLKGTGNVVKGVTEPIPPVHEVAKGAASVTDATGDALKEDGTEVKNKF